VYGLERHPYAGLPAGLRDPPDPLDDEVTVLRPGAGEEEDALRLELRKAPNARTERVDPDLDLVRPLEKWQRQDPRDRGDARGRAQRAVAQERCCGTVRSQTISAPSVPP